MNASDTVALIVGTVVGVAVTSWFIWWWTGGGGPGRPAT